MTEQEHIGSVAMGDAGAIEEAKSIAADINSLLPGEMRQMTFWHNAALKMAAALSRPTQEPVAVKPLEWIGNEARSSLGDLYSVQQLSPNVWTTYMNGTAFPGWKAQRSSAMALAQENDNRRAAPQPAHGTSATERDTPAPANHLTGLSGCEVDPQSNGSLRHSEHNADSKHDSQSSAVTHAAGISSPAAPANHALVSPDQERMIRDIVRAAYDRGYNDARNVSAVPGDNAPGYRGRDIEAERSDELLARFKHLAAILSPPAPAPNLRGRPAGHCDDDEAWQQFSTDYAHHPRANLGKGDMTDFALANAQFMCDRNSLDLIVYQTAVKERIRWLSIQLAAALAAKTPSPDCIEDAAKHVFNAMRVAAKEAGVNAPAWADRGNSTMQEEARSAAYRILNTPAATQDSAESEASAQNMREALERIAGPRDCGCSPSCQCNSQESLEVEVDALRDIALAALSSTRVIMNDEGKSKPPSPAPISRGSREIVIACIMEQAQVFASTYSLVGGRFDDGSKMGQSEDEKAELERMIRATLAVAEGTADV